MSLDITHPGSGYAYDICVRKWIFVGHDHEAAYRRANLALEQALRPLGNTQYPELTAFALKKIMAGASPEETRDALRKITLQ